MINKSFLYETKYNYTQVYYENQEGKSFKINLLYKGL